MPAKVTLKGTTGKLSGQEFVFAERTTCVAGRAEDCSLKIPDDEFHRMISRHHCLLDINPPDIRVRDFGSLNGTFVNGKKIGQREQHQTPEEAAKGNFPEVDLKDGDEIQLGSTVFRLDVFVPQRCAECDAEIPGIKVNLAGRSPAVRCPVCEKKAQQKKIQEPPKKKPRLCAKCGRDVSAEMGENRYGEYLCKTCQADPWKIIEQLLGLAGQGQKELLTIKGYSIQKELGRGGMGAVYLARHEQTGEFVALKVMLPKVAMDKLSKEYFLRETENTKALKHPNILTLKDAGCYQGTFFFTLEFCEGGSVDKLMLKRAGVLPVAEAVGIIVQALDGLEYSHQAQIPYVKLADGRIGQGRGLVHRDIKPSNIFLSGNGVAKVGDFGLAKAFDTAGLSGYTRTGTVAGTPEYMPRQMVINFKYAKPEVDVWAMAATLYTMLTGAIPRDFFRNKDPWQIVLQTDPVPIRKRNPAIPKGLAGVIDQALMDRPQLHFKTAVEFKAALKKAL